MLKVTTALSIASAENTKENTATVGSVTVLPLQSVKVNSPLTFQGFGTLPFTINHNCKLFYFGRQIIYRNDRTIFGYMVQFISFTILKFRLDPMKHLYM